MSGAMAGPAAAAWSSARQLKPMLSLSAVALAVAVAIATAMAGVGVGATDSDPLQDFCVADVFSGVFVNGYPCKNPLLVTSQDFSFSGLSQPAPIDPGTGAGFIPAFARQWPGLNTLGLSLVRLDFNPGGVIAPHTHNLASEILFCLEGEIHTGFVTNSNNPNAPNKLFTAVVKKGEAVIFPRGLLHFQINKSDKKATSINFLNSQNPGFQVASTALFASNPPIDIDVLAKSFSLSKKMVADLELKIRLGV